MRAQNIARLLVILLIVLTDNTSHSSDLGDKTTGGQRYRYTIRHDALVREYEVYLPKKYNHDGGSLPLVLYIHGGGGKIKSAYLDGLDKAADQFGFVLAVPQGLSVEKGILGTRWNGGHWDGGSCCGNADDIGFISKMIDEVIQNYRIHGNRVYVTGISNGALMTMRIACELADKVAAVATVAPTAVPGDCTPSRPISVMDIHGTADPVNPFYGGEPRKGAKVDYRRMPPSEVVDILLKTGDCSGTPKPFYHKGDATCSSYDCRGGSEVVFCKVENMGHTYPSGSQYFFKKVIGSVSYDIGPPQIWKFFMRHSLDE